MAKTPSFHCRGMGLTSGQRPLVAYSAVKNKTNSWGVGWGLILLKQRNDELGASQVAQG